MRLGEILSVITDGTHKTPTYVEKGIPFLSVQNISSGSFTLSPLKFISPDEHAKLSARVSPQIGDVLVCRIGTLGKAIVNTLDFEFSIFVSLGLLRPLETSLSDYLTFLINSPLGENWIDKNKVGGGTHTYKINLTSFPSMLIPLPPIREQQRISSAIEIFLEKVTKYGQIEQKLTTLDTTFSSSLKKSILQHAIQGKLVPQDPNDEPASVLLERIAKERAKLGKKAAKSMSRIERRDRGTFLISPDGTEKDITADLPFDIPYSWEWCLLDELGETNIGLTYKPADIKAKGVNVLRANNIRDGKICYDGLIRVNCEVPQRALIHKGDLLICARNGSKKLVGKTALIERDGDAFGAFMAKFSSPINDYLYYFLNAQFFREQLDEANTTTIYQVTQSMLRNTICPLPPLAEQRRICQRLEILLQALNK